MKQIIQSICILAGVMGLAACAEDSASTYSSSQSGGYASNSQYPSEVTVGYNRDYQSRANSGYRSNNSAISAI